MKEIFKKYFFYKNEFRKNVFTLFLGTTLAQAITIGISPILTRIYSPEDFGLFALYVSVLSVCTILSTGRYELAIMLPEKDEDAIRLTYLSSFIVLSVSSLLMIIIYFFHEDIALLLGNKDISLWLFLIPISIIVSGSYQILNYWNNRNKTYKDISRSKVLMSVGNSATSVGMGLMQAVSGGLIIGKFIGNVLGLAMLYRRFPVRKYFNFINKDKMIYLLKKHKKLPLINLPNALLDGFRMTSINLLISSFYSATFLGQFLLARRIVQFPANLFGSSISQVFFQKVSSMERKRLPETVYSFLKRLILIALPVFIIVYFVSPGFFAFVFSDKWKIAGECASRMSPWLFMNFLTSPLSTVFIVLNRQEILFILSFLYVLVPVSILYFFRNWAFIKVITLISASMSIVLLGFLVVLMIILNKERKSCE